MTTVPVTMDIGYRPDIGVRAIVLESLRNNIANLHFKIVA